MLELASVTKYVMEGNGSERVLLRDLSLTLDAAAFSIAIQGRSGSGKSTLLRILAGLDHEYRGEYRFNGAPVAKAEGAASAFRFRDIGYVTQDIILLPDRSVRDNVRLGLGPHMKGRKTDAQVSDKLLERVGLSGYGARHPRSLSGGEAQRVAIARALIKSPKLILADEPTGALDEDSEQVILDLFESMRSDHTQIVIATHSERVAQACDLAFAIDDGQLISRRARNPGRVPA